MSISVSATELANYAARYPCMRCAWVRMHVKDLPYQSFPGIFSAIDTFTKKVITSHFNQHGCLPTWMEEIGDVIGCVDPPGWRKFYREDEHTGVTVRGEADAIFQLTGGSYLIADYKTSRYNPERLYALRSYEIQLNAYAWIAESTGFSPVNRLALVFMEPASEIEHAKAPNSIVDGGIQLSFNARIVPVKRRPESLIPPILEKVRSVADMSIPPASRSRCRDCDQFDTMVLKMARGKSDGF